MRMLYKDMFQVDESAIPDTSVHSDEFEQQGASIETLPPCNANPKLGQQHSLMSNPDDWPDALFTPSVMDVVQELEETNSVSSTTTSTTASTTTTFPASKTAVTYTAVAGNRKRVDNENVEIIVEEVNNAKEM